MSRLIDRFFSTGSSVAVTRCMEPSLLSKKGVDSFKDFTCLDWGAISGDVVTWLVVVEIVLRLLSYVEW
jgi:hypothetical protein